MARTVRDAAILLNVLTGEDPEDPITKESNGKVQKDYTTFLDANGLSGKRIGVEKSMLEGHEGVTALMKSAIETMRSKGATIIEVEAPLNHPAVGVISFNKANDSTAMPFFKQDILESSEEKGNLDSKEYKDALKKILTTSRQALNSIMSEHQLDTVCGPATGPTWCTDLVNGDFFTGYGVYASAAIAGYPHITVPMGLVFELPIGLSFL